MRRTNLYIIYFILLNLLLCQKAIASIRLTDNTKRLDISKQIKIFEEAESSISFRQILNGEYDSKFDTNKIVAKLFNNQKRSFWVKINAVSKAKEDSEWILKLWNYYSFIECYLVYGNDTIIKQTSGWSLALNERSVKEAELVFRVPLKLDQQATIYLHILTDPSWNNPPELRAEFVAADKWITLQRQHWLLNGLLAGLVIIATIFAILNYGYGKKRYLLFLALSNLVMSYYFLNSSNIIPEFVFSRYPMYVISRYGLIYFCLPLFIISIGLLFISFGELNKVLPVTSKWYTRLTALMVFASITIPVLSLGESLMKYFFIVLMGWVTIHLVVWINLARKNNVIGKVGVLCYSPIGLGWYIECLRQADVLEDSIFVHDAFQLGAATTITVSMFTFLNFARRLRKKKILAQMEKEQLLIEQSIILESKVEQRTFELKDTNQILLATLQNLKETQSHLIESEKQKETEIIRSRISQDIHDDISSELSKISWMSELMKVRFQINSKVDSSDLLDKINISSRETISKLGEIIWAIKPENDNLESLLSYLRNHISNFLEHTSILYKIEFPENVNGIIISPEHKRNVFLVIKEALNNSVKYSEAKNILFTFNINKSGYLICISDDGKGIDENIIQGGGNGLINMKRRMENSGGSFIIETGKGKGTKIILQGELR